MSEQDQEPMDKRVQADRSRSDLNKSASQGLFQRILSFLGLAKPAAPIQQASTRSTRKAPHFAALKEEIARHKNNQPVDSKTHAQDLFHTIDDLTWPASLDEIEKGDKAYSLPAGNQNSLETIDDLTWTEAAITLSDEPMPAPSRQQLQRAEQATSQHPGSPVESITLDEEPVLTKQVSEPEPETPQTVSENNQKEQRSQPQKLEADLQKAGDQAETRDRAPDVKYPDDALAELERKKREIESALREHQRQNGL